jgi:Cu2+-exporting ATPase
MANGACYHCGEALPSGTAVLAHAGDIARPVCCHGCRAAVELIAAGGLLAYYDRRAAPAPRVTAPSDFRAYDHLTLQQEFIEHDAAGRVRAQFLIEGMSCSACAWVIEHRLRVLPGVHSARVDYASRRADLVWDLARLPVSDLLSAVAALGYSAQPSTRQAEFAARRAEMRIGLWQVAVAGLAMMQVMMFAYPSYVAAAGELEVDLWQLLRWASLLVATPAVLITGAPFVRGAWRDLRNRRAGMDVPVALGIAVAFGASAANTLRGAGEVYFDSVLMFVFLLLLARQVERVVRHRLARALDYLERVQPMRARRLTAYPHSEAHNDVSAADLAPGDVIAVLAGEAIPADGVILRGESALDESVLSGESRPLLRGCGSPVPAGAVNRDAPLLLRVERAAAHSTLAHFARLVRRAAAERPPAQLLAERIAAWFLFCVLVLAAAGATWWWYRSGLAPALQVAVAVLVVSCPCALSLATPVASAAGTLALARRGVIVTRAGVIEAMAGARHWVFDKTGTLTAGELQLVRVVAYRAESAEWCSALAARLEANSDHPIGRALAAAAVPSDVVLDDIRLVPGGGIEARIGGQCYQLGTHRFAAHPAVPEPDTELTQVWLRDVQGVLARFDLRDRPRAGCAELVAALRRRGLAVSLWSGDQAGAVAAVAAALQIKDWRAALRPQDKLDAMRAAQARGETVAMVGDGINDAPVLAQADCSIALGGGALLAQAQADAIVLGDDVGALRGAIELARRVVQIERQNFAWALVYNALALPAALAGWLTPWSAGLGMAFSSALVVLNAARLLPRRERSRRPQSQPHLARA